MTIPIFGAFVTAWQLEQAVIAHLREWMVDYLPHAKRKAETLLDRQIPDFPLPRSYTIVPREPDKWTEDQLPAILVVSPGIIDQPTNDGDGNYRARFSLGVGAICSTGDEGTSKLYADLYAWAASAICLDKPSLDGFAESTRLTGAENDWLAGERNRTLAGTLAQFEVQVAKFRQVTGGPAAHLSPPTTDPGDFPPPDTVHLDVEKETIP